MALSILKRSAVLIATAAFACNYGLDKAHAVESQDMTDFKFDGAISRRVLKNYLSRAITESDLLTGKGNFDDNLRMLQNIGAKFVGRTIYRWGSEDKLPELVKRAAPLVDRIHQRDSEMILQAAIFEVVSEHVNNLAIPSWVFEEFRLQPEQRNFRYDDIIFTDNYGLNKFGKGKSVPDITRKETKLLFFYLGATYIDLGMEAIHCGQVKLTARNDPKLGSWFDVLGRLRHYAKKHARRHFVLFDGHAPDHGFVANKKLLLDFHSFPSRPVEVVSKPEQTVLKAGHLDTIYGRSLGGITPSGWSCEHLPYLVELDNGGRTNQEGQPNVNNGYCIWGYDEISWFAHQPKKYRNFWLRYATNWLRKNDWDGFLEVPGSRPLSSPVGDSTYYFANTPSDLSPDGFDQEQTIKDIWSKLDHP